MLRKARSSVYDVLNTCCMSVCVNGVNVAYREKHFEWSVKTRKALYKYKFIYHLGIGRYCKQCNWKKACF